jgi:hypothetical protein
VKHALCIFGVALVYGALAAVCTWMVARAARVEPAPDVCRVIYIDNVAHPVDSECSTMLTK